MIFYIDTSLFVCLLTDEAKARDVEAWLAASENDELVVSGWVVAEVSSALAIKQRTGQMEARERADALAEFRRMMRDSLAVAPIAESHFQTAASIADRHDLGVKAGDALHLSIASAHGATVATLDRTMAAAGPSLGVPTILL